MKRFSLAKLLFLVTIVAVALAFLISQRENLRLKAEIVDLSGSLDSSEETIESLDEDLAHSRLGTALLCRMALTDKYAELLRFIDKIPAESLSCSIMDLPEYPSIRLVTYYQDRDSPDGTWLALDQCKSARIIVTNNSLGVVDYVMHQGFGGVSKVIDDPYITDWELPDGTTVEYKILPSGFVRIE